MDNNARRVYQVFHEYGLTNEQIAGMLSNLQAENGIDPDIDFLKSQDFTDLNWKEGDSEDKISKAQDVRGFHTLEYLIFKDGKARTVK